MTSPNTMQGMDWEGTGNISDMGDSKDDGGKKQ